MNKPDAELSKFPTLQEVADALRHSTTLRRKPWRTLPDGHQWAGHDIPGRGKAAKRRLRQLEKLGRSPDAPA